MVFNNFGKFELQMQYKVEEISRVLPFEKQIQELTKILTEV
jgi:hypothetical protein